MLIVFAEKMADKVELMVGKTVNRSLRISIVKGEEGIYISNP